MAPGVFGAGEMFHLWEEGAGRNDPCGCGLPFRRCPVWGEVAERVVELRDPETAMAVAARQRGLVMARSQPRMWTASGRRRLLAEIGKDHGRLLGRVYQAVADVTGDGVIVDSSKSSLYAWVLGHSPGIELAVVHLVRDPRATVGSRAVPKYDPRRAVEFQGARSTTRTALSWLTTHGSVEAMRRALPAVRQVVVRYEDFVTAPAAAVAAALPAGWATPPPLDQDVELPPSHLMAGDPDRFEHGPVRLQLREGWRQRISPSAAAAVTVLTAPLLRRYGYPLKV